MFNKFYSLRKSRRILHTYYNWYKKQGKMLPKGELTKLESLLEQLDQAVLAKDRKKADGLARDLEASYADSGERSLLGFVGEIVIAIVFALVIATVVRQVWFELYEIPSGSMRPTYREQDRLTVSKTAFGINIPLQAKHFLFDPDLVKRTGVLIWSGHNIDLPNTDANYFGIFPYKKQYIKRLIGKPGDTLYFYGGKIHGIDNEGNPIEVLLDAPWMQSLDHIPFLSFEGRPDQTSRQMLFKHFGQPVGRLSGTPYGQLKAEIYDGDKWVPQDSTHRYFDAFGIGNFATARLLTKKELPAGTNASEAPFHLSLSHHPTLNTTLSKGSQALLTQQSIIPVEEQHLDALKQALYTTRFQVRSGRARPVGNPHASTYNPKLPDVPDGVYEFYFGKGYSVAWGGVLTPLSEDHPLYAEKYFQKLFNFGITFRQASPSARFSYFRNGDLYVMGAPVWKKDDSTLETFNQKESRQESSESAYIAFKDSGTPSIETIQTFGVVVPEKHYLALGDNHAISSDSRIFGFVPEDNIQGVPSVLLWPPGHRWGTHESPYLCITKPRLIVWGIAFVVALVCFALYRYRATRPTFKKLS